MSIGKLAGTVAALAAFAGPVVAWAQETAEDYENCGWGGGHMWGGGGYGMVFGPLMMILFVIVTVVVVVVLVRWLGGHHQAPPAMPPGRTALDVLKERFARGEIDKDEFEERRRLLGD